MELLTSHQTMEWLRDIVIGDEKWVVYVSHTRKRQWLQSGETGIPMPKNTPYSPDLAQTDYHLFQSLAAFLDKNKFDEEDHLK